MNERLYAMHTLHRVLVPEEEQLLRSARRGQNRRRTSLLSIYTIGLVAAALPAAAQVQTTGTDTTILLNGPNFFLAVIAGLILAISFQLILSEFSWAKRLANSGTSGGNPRLAQASDDTSVRKRGHQSTFVEIAQDGEAAVVYGAIRRIPGEVGTWALLTASSALFLATWLAVELTDTRSAMVGAVLGLVIWGLSYVLVLALEKSGVTSLVGALMGTARAGLHHDTKSESALWWLLSSVVVSGIAAVIGGLLAAGTHGTGL